MPNIFSTTRLSEISLSNATKDWKERKKFWRHETKRNDIPKVLKDLWLMEHPQPPLLKDVLNEYGVNWENEKEDTKKRMMEIGDESEQIYLNQVITDISALLKNMTPKMQYNTINLLRSVIHLWAYGKVQNHNAERKMFYKKMNDINKKYDPRKEELYKKAVLIYNNYIDNARKLFDWLVKNRRNDIAIKGNKISIRKGLTDKSLSFMVKNSRQINYVEALDRANEKTFLSNSTFSKEEFEDIKIDLQNGFKEWRATHKM